MILLISRPGLFMLSVWFFCPLLAQAGEQPLATGVSPNGRIVLSVNLQAGVPHYQLSYDGTLLVTPSSLGMDFKPQPRKYLHIGEIRKSYQDSRWKPVWGQSSEIRDKYASLDLILSAADDNIEPPLYVQFRVYDDGVAFRYSLPEEQDDLETRSIFEHTQFAFSQDYLVRSYIAEHAPKVTESLEVADSLHIPVTLTASKGPYLALHEAALTHGAPMLLSRDQQRPHTLMVHHDGDQVSVTPHTSSWRVLFIVDRLEDLLTSNLLLNLSPPSRIEDTSWIKPGRALWDWRVRGATYGKFTYRLDTTSIRRFIEFSAVNNIQYIVIDANWYGPERDEDTDPFTPKAGLDIKALIVEARAEGVGLILYLNDKASIHYDLDKLFETYSSWGAAGIKYGFLEASGQEKVGKTLEIVQLAAKHRLLINFHDDPIAPTGLRRTYPNWLTREFVHGQTDAGRSFTPSEFLQMMNVNQIAGPLDMSNGFYGLDGLKESRNYVRSEVYSTVAGETARTLITFSGLIILPDAPEEYEQKSDLFEFIRKMPATWDETRILRNDPGRHIVVARRGGTDWFVGAAVNETGATLDLPLDFLDASTSYRATQYADATGSHYILNREAYEVRTKTVHASDTLMIALAPGGGQAIHFSPMGAHGERSAAVGVVDQ